MVLTSVWVANTRRFASVVLIRLLSLITDHLVNGLLPRLLHCSFLVRLPHMKSSSTRFTDGPLDGFIASYRFIAFSSSQSFSSPAHGSLSSPLSQAPSISLAEMTLISPGCAVDPEIALATTSMAVPMDVFFWWKWRISSTLTSTTAMRGSSGLPVCTPSPLSPNQAVMEGLKRCLTTSRSVTRLLGCQREAQMRGQ